MAFSIQMVDADTGVPFNGADDDFVIVNQSLGGF
jgi:hypothetical protein